MLGPTSSIAGLPNDPTQVKCSIYGSISNETLGAARFPAVGNRRLVNFFKLNNALVFLECSGTSYGFKTGIPAFDLGGANRFSFRHHK